MNDDKSKQVTDAQKPELLKVVFENYEAKCNLVGLFDLLLKVDKRNNPEKYTKQVVVEQVIQ
jgi:hypothetical protein